MKLKDIKTAETVIIDFCDMFSAKCDISNAKGLWTAQIKRNNVRVMLVTGETLLDAQVNLAKRINLKRDQVGQ